MFLDSLDTTSQPVESVRDFNLHPEHVMPELSVVSYELPNVPPELSNVPSERPNLRHDRLLKLSPGLPDFRPDRLLKTRHQLMQ
jgi:hypothetical protein